VQFALRVGVQKSLGGGRMTAMKDETVWEDGAKDIIQVVEEK
jgi:hypothetical protein